MTERYITFEEALKRHSWEERMAQLEARKIKPKTQDVRDWLKELYATSDK